MNESPHPQQVTRSDFIAAVVSLLVRQGKALGLTQDDVDRLQIVCVRNESTG